MPFSVFDGGEEFYYRQGFSLVNIGAIAFKVGRTCGRGLGWFWLCFFGVFSYRASWWVSRFFGVILVEYALWSMFLGLYLLPFMLNIIRMRCYRLMKMGFRVLSAPNHGGIR